MAKVSARSDSQVLFDVISDLIGGGYAISTSNAKVDIHNAVSIAAAHGVELSAWSDNTIAVGVQVGGDLAYGTIRGLSGTPFGIAALVTEANSAATVTVGEGADVHTVAGDVCILAVNTKTIAATAKAIGEYKVLAATGSWATGLATAQAVVNGTVTSEQGDVAVRAQASSLGTLSDSYSQIGATTATKYRRKKLIRMATLPVVSWGRRPTPLSPTTIWMMTMMMLTTSRNRPARKHRHPVGRLGSKGSQRICYQCESRQIWVMAVRG